MATFTPSPNPNPMVIDKFLGINESVAENEMKIGECTSQVNFRVTKDFKLEKRSGYATFIDYGNEKAVYFWHGTLDGDEVIISTNNGKVYEKVLPDGENTEIGTIGDYETIFFQFDGTLYMMNGVDYKSYDGTTFGDTEPYIPTIAIGSPPTGGGTNFEEINLLTGYKKQDFIGDGTETEYVLAEQDIDSSEVFIEIDGVDLEEDTDFTVDRTAGTVDFSSGTSPFGAPDDLSDVYITWDKADTGSVSLVTSNKYAVIFGIGTDTNVFIWGDSDNPNIIRRSGVGDPTYFPSNNFLTVGTSNTSVTDIVPQYDRLIIFKESKTYYAYPEENPLYDDNPGLNIYNYVARELNDAVGNITFNQCRVVENYPVSFNANAFWKWTSTQVKDERNAQNISDRISITLSNLDLSKAITLDYQKEKELWVNIEDEVIVWNYLNDVFYIYDSIEAKQFLEINGEVYFSTEGTIEKFGYLNDNDIAINSVAELGFTDFKRGELVKNSRKIWVSVKPRTKTSLTLSYATNNDNEEEINSVTVGYSLLDYGFLDYANWTYLTNRNPQTLTKRIRARKYTHIKIILSNNIENETLVVLWLKLPAEIIGEVR